MTRRAPAEVPQARGTLVAGALAAVRAMWEEEGIARLGGLLEPEVRHALLDAIVLPVGWYPEPYFESLCHAVWNGLAARDDALFQSFIHGSIDSVWGRVHRVLMGLATPGLLARRAPELWRHDHSHGELSVELRDRSGTIRIARYPYIRADLMAHAQAESLRYILSHARVREVRVSHVLQDDVLSVKLDWE